MSGSDPVELYTMAAAVFGGAITELSDDQWDLATWPEGWTVVTTVAWVVVGDSQVPLAVSGSDLDPPTDFDVGVLGTNPAATWRGTALAAVSALSTPGALERRIPMEAGEMMVLDLVGQRVTENLVRASDIVGAVGAEPLAGETVEKLADWSLDFWAGHSAAIISGTILPDKPLEPPAGADLLTRLRALTGRPGTHDS